MLHNPRFCAGAVVSGDEQWWAVVRRLVGKTSAIRRRGRSGATGYLTVTASHLVVAAACVAVLAIAACARWALHAGGVYLELCLPLGLMLAVVDITLTQAARALRCTVSVTMLPAKLASRCLSP